MHINENTKIAELIKFNFDTIEALASFNSLFEKLRNPVLRKILASRVSIRDAARIGGVEVEVFFSKLRSLGFDCKLTGQKSNQEVKNDQSDMLRIHTSTRDVDVRPILAAGKDPFNYIMESIKELPIGVSLKVINTFEPTPLIRILEKKGFVCGVVQMSESEFHTYIKRTDSSEKLNVTEGKTAGDEHALVKKRFEENFMYLDVRHLEMPQPMITILKSLETLPQGKALFVKHKKVPQFLFPELVERNFNWSVHELSENEVDLIIYRK